MHYLNLGCGHRFHSDWVNVDFNSTGEGVTAYNLSKGIPYPDQSFDVVYHSHVLEHFPKTSAEFFLKECHRVLRASGVLRVVIPDLEQIARTYLSALEQAICGGQDWAVNHNWMILEMYDQSIRNYSGGEMAAYLFNKTIPNEEFVVQRLGTEAKKLIAAGRRSQQEPQPTTTLKFQPLQQVKQAYRFFRYPAYRREIILKHLLGKDYEALEIGRFRQSGEIHQWMYDRFSLTSLLRQCGFQQIIQQSAATSLIPNWSNFHLDTEPDGSIYKPDSIYFEALKPPL
jgi:predicted SAM-dependent methyltransferase